MLPEVISHYRIVRKIGSGGMGEVFEAQDTRLGRRVALKILPADVATDPKRLRRFIQEAKAASALSHPNITHIYEIGDEEEHKFIAMELISGETLQDLLQNRTLEFEEILKIGVQVADALQEAHSNGVTHRDMKPANIMITQKSQVKILDFGLAKIEQPAHQDLEELSTRAKTEPGALMGTVPYMSPEQALGHDLDHRSDIFSVGAVLYEMASGRRPFSGRTATATIDQILHSQPESVLQQNSHIPPEFDRIIFKCLRKDPNERYQTAQDLLTDLRFLQKEDPGKSLSKGSRKPEYFIARNLARGLFILLQCVYLAMYISALHWSQGMEAGLVHVLARKGEALSHLLILIATIGIAVRLYLMSSVLWDHVQTGVRYRKAFPFYFILDELWILAPFGLSLRIGEILALACIPPLVFSPFGQRTLIRSAYDVDSPSRFPSPEL